MKTFRVLYSTFSIIIFLTKNVKKCFKILCSRAYTLLEQSYFEMFHIQ